MAYGFADSHTYTIPGKVNVSVYSDWDTNRASTIFDIETSSQQIYYDYLVNVVKNTAKLNGSGSTPNTDGTYTHGSWPWKSTRDYYFSYYKIIVSSDDRGSSNDPAYVLDPNNGKTVILTNRTAQNQNANPTGTGLSYIPGMYIITSEIAYHKQDNGRQNNDRAKTQIYPPGLIFPPYIGSLTATWTLNNNNFVLNVACQVVGNIKNASTQRFRSRNSYNFTINYNNFPLNLYFIEENGTKHTVTNTVTHGVAYPFELPDGITPYTKIRMYASVDFKDGGSTTYRNMLHGFTGGYLPTVTLEKLNNNTLVVDNYLAVNSTPFFSFYVGSGTLTLSTPVLKLIHTASNQLQLNISQTYTHIGQGAFRVDSGFVFIPKTDNTSEVLTDLKSYFTNMAHGIPSANPVTYSNLSSTTTNKDTNTIILSQTTLKVYNHTTDTIVEYTSDSVQLDQYTLVGVARSVNQTNNENTTIVTTHATDLATYFSHASTDISYDTTTTQFGINVTYSLEQMYSPLSVDQFKEHLWFGFKVDNGKTGQNQKPIVYFVGPAEAEEPTIDNEDSYTFTNFPGGDGDTENKLPEFGESFTKSGSVRDYTFTLQDAKLFDVQSINYDTSVYSYLRLNNSSFWLSTPRIDKTFGNQNFIPKPLTISTIHDNPSTKNVHFTYRLNSYVTTISFELNSTVTVDSATITVSNDEIDLTDPASSTFSQTLSYKETEFDGADFSISYILTNTIAGGTPLTFEKDDIDVGDTLNAFPDLKTISFSFQEVTYTFEMSKPFVDDVDDDILHDISINFRPLGEIELLKTLDKTERGVSYEFVKTFSFTDMDKYIKPDTTYAFRVDTLVHDVVEDYSSSEITVARTLDDLTPKNLDVSFINPLTIRYRFDLSKSLLEYAQNKDTNNANPRIQFVVKDTTTSTILTDTTINAVDIPNSTIEPGSITEIGGDSYEFEKEFSYTQFVDSGNYTFSVTTLLDVIDLSNVDAQTITTISKETTADISYTVPADPELISVDFTNPTTVKYTFDYSKEFIDEVVKYDSSEIDVSFTVDDGSDIHERHVRLSTLSKTTSPDDSTKYRFVRSYSYPNVFTIATPPNNYSFKIATMIRNTATSHVAFESESILEDYVMNAPTFSISFHSTGYGVANQVTLSALSISKGMFGALSLSDITYTIEPVVPSYTGDPLPAMVLPGTTTTHTFPYYFSNQITVNGYVTYKDVGGQTATHMESLTNMPIRPFPIRILHIKKADAENNEITVSVSAYAPLSSFTVRLVDLEHPSTNIDISTVDYADEDSPDDYILSLTDNINFESETMRLVQKEVVLDTDANEIFDNFRVYAKTTYKNSSSAESNVSANFTVTFIENVTAHISTPYFIDLVVDVGTVNEDWKNANSKGFLDIYEYRSSSPFTPGNINKDNFDKIKRCTFTSADVYSRIDGFTDNENEYVINTYVNSRLLRNGWYYAHYVVLGLFNELGHEITRPPPGNTLRTYRHADVLSNDNSYTFSFHTDVRFGYIASGEHTIATLPDDSAHLASLKNSTSSSLYGLDVNNIIYDVSYTHLGTSNARNVVYTSTSTPRTETDNGNLPEEYDEMEYVDDTSRVRIEIAQNYRLGGVGTNLIEYGPTKTQEVSTLIQPENIENERVLKQYQQTDDNYNLKVEWTHRGIIEYFNVTVTNMFVDPNTPEHDEDISGKYVIGTDTSNTEYSYSYVLDYSVNDVDADLSLVITPFFYTQSGIPVESEVSFTFDAVDIELDIREPGEFSIQFDISGQEQREATSKVAILIRADETEPNPADYFPDPEDVFAFFRNSSDSQTPQRLQQLVFDYPNPFNEQEDETDISSSYLFFANQMLNDLSFGFQVPVIQSRYYSMTVCPIVELSDRGVSVNAVSPFNEVQTVQLQDICNVDISLIFHQSYTKSWYTHDATTELARFGIPSFENANIMELIYTVHNGWPNRLVIEVTYDGTEEYSEVDVSDILNVRTVYRGLSFEDPTTPRYEGFEKGVTYHILNELLPNKKYYPSVLEFSRTPEYDSITELVDISNTFQDNSASYFSLTGHYLFSYVDNSNISIRVTQERDFFQTDTSASATIPTPVMPPTPNPLQLHAKNLWTDTESRRIHVYFQNYDLPDHYDLNALSFFVTVRDTSTNEFLKPIEEEDIFDELEMNHYEITQTTEIAYNPDAFTNEAIPVFSFDVSYGRQDENTEVDISMVVKYFDVTTPIVETELKVLSTKPEVLFSSIPNATTNSSQDPKEIGFVLTFLTTQLLNQIKVRVYSESSDVPISTPLDGSFNDWITISNERLEIESDTSVYITSYNPSIGLREFTRYYFKFQGVYGSTTTTWSDTKVVVIEELVKRPTIDISFVGYRLPYFANELQDILAVPDPLRDEDIYPVNRLTIDIEQVPHVQSYTFDFHYSGESFVVDVDDLPFVAEYTFDYVAIADIRPNYDNLELDTALQTVSCETLVVPTILNGNTSKGNNTFRWNPAISFSRGYEVLRSVSDSPRMHPNDVSFIVVAKTNRNSRVSYYDRNVRTNDGKQFRFNPYVYYGVRALYVVGTDPDTDEPIQKYSDISPIVYFAYDIGCLCPLPGQVLQFNSHHVIRQMSTRRRIGQRLMSGVRRG